MACQQAGGAALDDSYGALDCSMDESPDAHNTSTLTATSSSGERQTRARSKRQKQVTPGAAPCLQQEEYAINALLNLQQPPRNVQFQQAV